MKKEQTDYIVQIINCEEKLLTAFENKNLLVLEDLIHNDALFILPNALTVTKEEVINNYRGGEMNMTSIKASDQKINCIGDTAVVSVNLQLSGTYDEQKVNAGFRYLRVWKLINANWKVIATSGVPITK